MLVNFFFCKGMFYVLEIFIGSIKKKRAHSKGEVKHRSIVQLYNKLTEVVSMLGELMKIQVLTDTTILQVCRGFKHNGFIKTKEKIFSFGRDYLI